jgi:mono/diheme cytochrome c family protein
MRRWLPILTMSILAAGCTVNTPPAPAVTAAMAASGHVTQQQLTIGRTLFVSRCIDCHVLPEISEHSRDEWPGIVARMAKRAELKPEEQRAVAAYILAAR